MTVNLGIPSNWMTLLGGFLIGVPPIIVGSGLVLSPQWQHVLYIVAGVGGLLLASAKQFNTHSTQQEVATSTVAKETVKKP